MTISRSNIIKRLILLPLISVTLFAALFLSSCRKPQNGKKTEATHILPRLQAPTVFQNGKLWYCNQFRSMTEPPFNLPEGTPEIDRDHDCDYSYDHFSAAEYDSFISDLENSGFELAEMKWSSFLFRDDCMIFVRYFEDEECLNFSWYSRSRYARDDDGFSAYSDSLSKVKIHPIDVTPEGFYELTGGQLFASPVYSYDGFKLSGLDDLMFEDNEWYSCSFVFVKDDIILPATMESVAICDIDGDRQNDVVLLSYGPTSGLFTFDVAVVTGDGIYDTIFNTKFQVIGFA